MLEAKIMKNNFSLEIQSSDLSSQIILHSIYLSRLRDKSNDNQGKIEFDFQKNWIILTSFNGYGFLRTKIKCKNEDVDKSIVKPLIVDIKDIQSLVKSFDALNSDLIIINYSESGFSLTLPSTSSKKVKNSIRVFDSGFPRLTNRGKSRSIEDIDLGMFTSIFSRIISSNFLTDSGSYFDFIDLIIGEDSCRATTGNGSFFSSIEWGREDPFVSGSSWSFSIVAIAMILKIVKKSKSKKLTIVEYENCVRYKLDAFEIISLDKFESKWPDVNSIIKRSNDVIVSINVDSAKSVRDFLTPVLDQAHRDKIDVPSVSLSFDLSEDPSVEIQSNFKNEMYLTLDSNYLSVDKNENGVSVFICNVSLKSIIDSLNISSSTTGVEFKMSEDEFNGHSSPVLIEHIDDEDCQFSSFFAQVE